MGAHLGLLILRIVLSVDIARRRLIRYAKRGIAHLRWKVIFEVEETRLAHVTRLGACLAYDRRLESHTGAGVPAEDCERTRAGPAFASELLLGLEKEGQRWLLRHSKKKRTHHPDEWVVA